MNRIAFGLYGLLLVLLVLVGAVYLHERPAVVDNLTAAYNKLPFVDPCAKAITYRVNSIDSRFGLTTSEVAQKLEAAATLWNTAAGKVVLVYAPGDSSALPINFIYDKRQQVVSVGQKIDSTEAAHEATRAALERDQAAFLSKQQAYASAIATFNADSKRYAAEVSRINAQGGADPATYDRLNREKAELKSRQQDLDQQGAALDQEASALKARVSSFNAGVRSINQVVADFNSVAGEDFEEGQYVVSGSEKRIDIYAFKSENELLHTLTHEFGHALGLPHNQNPASIMFPYNKDGVSLSEDDIAALKLACRLD